MASHVTDPTTLSPLQKAQVLAGMLLALFLGALDQTVVATAGPDIQRTLHIEASLYAWITTAYLVASTVLVPVYGKLSDVIGRKKVVVFGIVLFVSASVLCGLSQTTAQLIAFRALQGAGSASLFTSAFSVVADLYPPSERGKYSGLFGAVFGVSSLVGPLLGGFITDAFGWHWVFFINLPLGIIALVFIVWRMPPLKPVLAVAPRLDVVGALLLAMAVVPALIALTLGRPLVRPGELGYLWTDWHVLGLFGISALGLAMFVPWELRVAQPLIDLRFFRSRMMIFGNAAVFVLGGAFLTPMVFLPLFMVNVVGVSATASGLTISPLVMGVVAGNVVSGQLVSRLGRYKALMVGGLVLQIAGFLVMALTLRADSTQGEVTVKMVLLGLGLGPSIPLYTIAIQNAAPPQAIGAITSLITFFRQMGSTVGIAIVGSLFAGTLTQELDARMTTAMQGVPPEVVQRFGQRAPAGEEGIVRFDVELMKQQAGAQLDGAFQVTRRALEGELIAGQLVLASPLADAALKQTVEAGGARAQARATFTVIRQKVRAASATDEAWSAFRAQTHVKLPEQRPANESALTAIDADLEAAADAAGEAALNDAVNAAKSAIESKKPQIFSTVEAVGRALRESFTEAILMVYRLALGLAVLALLLTLPLPELPLSRRGDGKSDWRADST